MVFLKVDVDDAQVKKLLSVKLLLSFLHAKYQIHTFIYVVFTTFRSKEHFCKFCIKQCVCRRGGGGGGGGGGEAAAIPYHTINSQSNADYS